MDFAEIFLLIFILIFLLIMLMIFFRILMIILKNRYYYHHSINKDPLHLDSGYEKFAIMLSNTFIFMVIIIGIFWLLGYYDTEYPIGYYDTEYPNTNSDIITKLWGVMTAIVCLCLLGINPFIFNNRFEESNFFSKETKYWFKMFVIILWLYFTFLILMV